MRTSMEYIETVLKYIVNTASISEVSIEDLEKALDEAAPDKGGDIMPTIAEALIEQGVQKGMKQGLQQGVQQGMEKGVQQGMEQGVQQGLLRKAREDIFEILEARFDVVPRSVIESVGTIEDLLFLKVLLKKAATADSIEQYKQIMKELMDG